MTKKQKQNKISPFPQRKKVTRFDWRKSLGKIGEQYVVDLLNRQGWQIKERNWRAGRYAEIDIIACDPTTTLVFIEVKTRIKTGYETGFTNPGFDKLDQRKINKMIAVARLYMAKCLGTRSQTDLGCRFDAFILYYPSAIRELEWKTLDPLIPCTSITPEVLHVQDLLN